MRLKKERPWDVEIKRLQRFSMGGSLTLTITSLIKLFQQREDGHRTMTQHNS